MLHCLMMDMIAQLTLGLEFDPALVEDGIKVNHKTLGQYPKQHCFHNYLIDRNVVEEWIVNPRRAT